MATHPADGEGTECEPSAPSSCGVARDTTIELRFERHIAPSTAVRQSIRVFTGADDNALFLEPTYDPIERVVTYEPSQPLQAGTLYTVVVEPKAKGNTTAFRAFDGAQLATDGPVPLTFNFKTREDAPADPPGRLPPPSCNDVVNQVFAECAAACHRAAPDPPPTGCRPGEFGTDAIPCMGVPRQGLRLDSPAGLFLTAIGRVAHQTETGPSGGVVTANPDRFGVQMPIVDPGNPGNSYLVYKLLVHLGNYLPAAAEDDPCESRHAVGAADTCVAPEEAEIERLRGWFVRGRPMPATGALTREQVDQVVAWIRGLGTPSSIAQCD